MSGTGNAPPPLHRILNEEVAQLRDFLVLLEKEQQALIAGDIEQLISLAGEKNGQFGRLAMLGEARGKALASGGFAADRRGMESWLERNADVGEAKRDWRDLLTLAGKSRALNQTNGELIATRLAHNQQALSALMAAANQAALYGPDGQAHPLGGGRSLGSV